MFVGGEAEQSPRPCFLFRNSGGGQFEDISTASKVANISARVLSTTWFDFDNDSYLDLFLGTVQEPSNYFLKNQGNGTFNNLTANVGVNGLFSDTRGIAAGDYDRDGDLDIIVPNTGPTRNYFFRNDGPMFTEIAMAIGVALDSDYSHSAEFADYDNDGDLDLLIGNNDDVGPLRLLKNESNSFVEATALSGLNPTTSHFRGSAFADFDNDGALDLVFLPNRTNRNVSIYRSIGNGSFVDVSASAGIDTLLSSLTLAVSDFDGDGKIDLYIGTDANEVQDRLYRNTTSSGNWLKLKLIGTQSNRFAVGSWIEITIQGKKQYRQIDAGKGYNTQNDFVQHFGLGNASLVNSIRIEWPSGIVQNLNDVSANQLLTVTEAFANQPAAPRNLSYLVSANEADLFWDANTESDFQRYRIYGGTTANPTTKIDSVDGAANTSYTARNLLPGQNYYFRLTAVNTGLMESAFSNEIHVVAGVNDPAPAPPQNVRATAGNGQVTLNWNPNTEADFVRYRISGGTFSGATTLRDSVNGINNTSKIITGLQNGVTYYFRLRAVDLALNASAPSVEVSATPQSPDPPPAAPQNLQAVASVGTVTLTWNANAESDLLRYRIYSSIDGVAFSKRDSLAAGGTTKTLAGLSNGTTYYFHVTAVDAARHESQPSSEASATPFADVTPPQIALASSLPTATLNAAVSIAINASDAYGLQSVKLFYRSGGDAAFANRPMLLQSGALHSADIPGAAVNTRGVEFYVQATDNYGNVANSSRYPVRVFCPNGISKSTVQPQGSSASEYGLFSVPLDLDNKSPQAFLDNIPALSAADPSKYRWYGFDRASAMLREFPNFSTITLLPDMGFALLANLRNVKLRSGSGMTVPTTAPYAVSLPQGWNLIGNPFNYNIPLDSVRTSAGTFELWSFEGDWQINTQGLEPWGGYALWLSQPATLTIRPGLAGLNGSASFYNVAHNTPENWLIQITADNGRSASRCNFVGQHEAATAGVDALDLHRPFALAEQVTLSFESTDSREPLQADVRPPSPTGHVWQFSVQAHPGEEVFTLSFAGIATLPLTHEVFLLDVAAPTAFDLRRHAKLEFVAKNSGSRRFTLLVGPADFVQAQQAEAGIRPTDYSLLQNFPNPFNPITQIFYALPQDGHVQLAIYDLRGQRVALLVDERQPAGQHSAVWQAQEQSSGVYFIKLQTGGLVQVRKAVLMK